MLAEAKRDHEHTSTHLCNSLITAYRFPLLVLLFLLLALRGLLYGLLRSRLLFCLALRRCGGRCGLFNGRSCHWRHPHRGAEGGTVSARCLVTLSGCPPTALLPLWILTTTCRTSVRTAVPVVERASAAASTARTAILLTAGLRDAGKMGGRSCTRPAVDVGVQQDIGMHMSSARLEGTTGKLRTLGPLYRLPWYFSASLMHVVWLLNWAGPLNVVLQSMQLTEEWHCW